MSTVKFLNYDAHELEDLPEFEKIRRNDKIAMPTHRSRSAINASRKSPKSKSVSRQHSHSNGGKHRRRLRRMR